MKRTDDELRAALESIPVFPLPVVLFPRALMPLHIFEPRYRAMLADCLATHRAIALAYVPDPSSMDENGHPNISTVAGAGFVLEHQALDDGRSNILLHGVARVELEELPFVGPYRRARGRLLKERPAHVSGNDVAALLAEARAFLTELARHEARLSFDLPKDIDAAGAADLCAHHLIARSDVRQAILSELSIEDRVQRVLMELASQREKLARGRPGSLN